MSLTNNQIGDMLPCRNEDASDILANILNLNLVDGSNNKSLTSTINSLLTSSKNREQGLEYLNLIIDNCPLEIITENALNWTNHCLVKYPGDSLKEIKLITIGKIISNASKSPDFSKKFVSDYISKVLEMCLTDHSNLNELGAALDTLTVCMKVYSSWFGNHKGKIEPFLLKFLEQKSTKLVEKAANAFLYMLQIGNAGLEGVNHKNNFSNAVSKLCATLQHLYENFFENDLDFDSNEYRTELEGFTFTASDYDSQKMAYVTARRIMNCVKFLMIMLRKSFPVCKEIKAEEILDTIKCGLNLHRCLAEGKNTFEDYQTAVLLIDVQIHCLQLLRILIVWGQSHLTPFAHTISKILIDALSMSQKCPCFSSNSIFQETVYKTLCTWIRVAKCGFLPHFQDHLVTCILHDISPVKTTVTLNIDVDPNNTNKSKKAKRKAVQDKVIASGTQNNDESQTNLKSKNRENICTFAMNTLKQLMIATDLKIKTGQLKEIYSVITGSLLELSYSKPTHPYTNTICQEKLFEVLVSFYEQPTLNIYPHLQMVLTILNSGVAHHNRHIAVTCEHGLSNLEKLCQPLYPPLHTHVPGEEREENNALEISFESYSTEVIADAEETEGGQERPASERELNTINRVSRSPAWSLETELLDNGFQREEEDVLQIRHDEPAASKVTVLQNTVISPCKQVASVMSPQTEQLPISLPQTEEVPVNDTEPIEEQYQSKNDGSNEEPLSKKMKVSTETFEDTFVTPNQSVSLKSEILSQEVGTEKSCDDSVREVKLEGDKVANTGDESDTTEIYVLPTDSMVNAHSDATVKTVEVLSSSVEVIRVEESVEVTKETDELLEDSFIDEVKDY